VLNVFKREREASGQGFRKMDGEGLSSSNYNWTDKGGLHPNQRFRICTAFLFSKR